MKCPKCNQENDGATLNCKFCGIDLEQQVRPMSSQERDTFVGVTIDDTNADSSKAQEANYKQQRSYRGENRGYARSFSFGSEQKLWKNILFWLVILAFVFFVLPTFIMIGLAIFAIWFVFNLFS